MSPLPPSLAPLARARSLRSLARYFYRPPIIKSWLRHCHSRVNHLSGTLHEKRPLPVSVCRVRPTIWKGGGGGGGGCGVEFINPKQIASAKGKKFFPRKTKKRICFKVSDAFTWNPRMIIFFPIFLCVEKKMKWGWGGGTP